MVMHSNVALRALAFGALLLVAASCSTMKVGTDYYEPFSYEGHDTFAWVSEHPMVVSSPDVSPFAEARLQQAIIDTLQQKGVRYVSDPAQAKLLVGFSMTTKQKISVYPASYPAPYWGMYPWVGSYYNNYYNGVDVHQYSVGRLTIDIFDTEGTLPVWHGWSSKTIGDDGGQKGEGLAQTVAAIFADFPPGSAPKK
jgi:hypothetical protein